LSLRRHGYIFAGWFRCGAMPRRLIVYAPALLWALLLLWVGGSTELPTMPPVRHLDKVMHFAAYGVLGALLAASWVCAGRWPWWGWLMGGALLLGALDEYRQSRTPGRDADVADWVADALGASAGFYLTMRLTRRSHERRNDE
jgi:VanZ family protein